MATPAAALAEAHHYVPQFYLKGFTEKKVLWVYEQGKPPRDSKPKYEAHRENYYTHNDRGTPDSTIEKMLSKVESVAAPIFVKLANRQFQMTRQQRDELFTFVALTFVRVPAYRSYIDRALSAMMKKHTLKRAQDREAFYADCKKVEAESGRPFGDYEELRQWALKGEYDIDQKSAGYNMATAFQSSATIMDILIREYSYDLWYATDPLFFMTCDNPVFTFAPDGDGRRATAGVGFGWANTEVLFPLNKRACIILRRSGRERKFDARERRVEQINNFMMNTAQQYLYAPRGYRRISRLFDERGCKIKYGGNAFVTPEFSESV